MIASSLFAYTSVQRLPAAHTLCWPFNHVQIQKPPCPHPTYRDSRNTAIPLCFVHIFPQYMYPTGSPEVLHISKSSDTSCTSHSRGRNGTSSRLTTRKVFQVGPCDMCFSLHCPRRRHKTLIGTHRLSGTGYRTVLSWHTPPN